MHNKYRMTGKQNQSLCGLNIVSHASDFVFVYDDVIVNVVIEVFNLSCF